MIWFPQNGVIYPPWNKHIPENRPLQKEIAIGRVMMPVKLLVFLVGGVKTPLKNMLVKMGIFPK